METKTTERGERIGREDVLKILKKNQISLAKN